MWRRACGSGTLSIPTGSRGRVGSPSWPRRASSLEARHWFWIPLLRPPARSRYGSVSTRARRPPSSFSNPITFATSIYSCAAIVPAHSARVSSFARTSVALYDGRGRNETPLWLPEQRTIVFADALTAPGGELRVWASPSHKERALPALRALLDLPFERVIVSHGEPVHTRADYERALDLPTWRG